ncbi:hypothetical protein J5N97_010297 [Dioscorea zingiberensis]|uniref:Cyclic nucleotide-binding domain-containing protein n=1 Tax=Dioscorea zingiberensis TaxID=325984 RepID=A0A9D5CZW8_9LILI|nr:hypothetical protein J5N97_010297 [Dioscorea zingiberensis]
MSSSDISLLGDIPFSTLSFNRSSPPEQTGSTRRPDPHSRLNPLLIFKNRTFRSGQDDDSGPTECYACTQAGAPAFHSTSCDRAHPPEWEANAGSSLIPIQPGSAHTQIQTQTHTGSSKPPSWVFGPVLDPRDPRVHRLNRVFLLSRAVALAVDPLFFYAVSVGRGGEPCVSFDAELAAAVIAVRTCVDVVHVWHVWLQLRMAYVSRESLVVGCGKLVWDPRLIAQHYARSPTGFWLDAFVVLPIPQIVFWLVLPGLIREKEIKLVVSLLLLAFLFQFIPKVYHSLCMMRRIQKVIGYIFGTIWWGFGLNLIAYFIASHVAGGCWYVLAIQRVASCFQHQCEKNHNCRLLSFACSSGFCKTNETICSDIAVCFNGDGSFRYGIYDWAVPVVASNSLAVKILYPIFWGLMTLSTFGNILEPTSQWLEVIFSIITVLSGLMLFTLLIGNIQVFLHAVMARKRKMQLKCRDMEWWMRRRQLPSRLRQRVRQYERQRWLAMRGEDEMELIKDLPQGLRQDIKRHLCLDLIKQVPWFHNLDDIILDNICDRVKHIVFSKDEKIVREGDPVQRMVFVVKGHIKSSQCLSKGMKATCMLGPGNFLGDELLSWCLRRPFIDRLPASSATFECADPTEAFGLDAKDLKYITQHFRYKFANERLKRTARYYSANWRTWAAVNIQLAWRRYKTQRRGMVTQPSEIRDSERRLRLYAAMFMSLRPHDHLE